MSERAYLAEQFETERQQHEAAQLGMWVFLGSEIMLFGGIFAGLMVCRLAYEQVLKDASHHLHLWIGGGNTVVLLTSSLTMVLAVTAARAGRVRATMWYLVATALLGVAFLGVKGYEYHSEYVEGLMPGVGPEFPMDLPPTQLFFNLYFAATGLHAFHLIGGVLSVAAFIWLISSKRLHLPAQGTRIENLGMYWHLVDIVWVFLYPVLYLV